jgi:YVTN family beta-propeller protein
MLAVVFLALLAAGPAPKVTAAPVQDSPVVVHIAASGTVRCSVDGHRARTCRRTTRLHLAPGLHSIAAWTVSLRGRASAKRRVRIVVPKPAPGRVVVGGQPVGIAAVGSTLWVSGGSSGEVVRVDAASRRVTGRVSVGGQLGGIAADASAVWVSAFDDGRLVKIDPATNTVVARIAVGGQPTSIAFGGGSVWVGNLDGTLARVDPASGVVTGHVALPSGASTLLSVDNEIWVGLQDGTLVTLDPAAGRLTGSAVRVAADVDALVDTPAGLWASTFGGIAARIDPVARRVTKRVTLPGRGSGIGFAGGRVWASAYDRRLVLALAPATGRRLAAVHTASQPRESLAVGSTLWVVDQGAGALTPVPAS